MNRPDEIRRRLTDAFAPSDLSIEDESHKHAGHAGAASGGGHFRIRIRAAAFAGKPPVERHRLVYAALGDLMQREIHALSIDAAGPEFKV